jgi:hypothetical protein
MANSTKHIHHTLVVFSGWHYHDYLDQNYHEFSFFHLLQQPQLSIFTSPPSAQAESTANIITLFGCIASLWISRNLFSAP